MALKIRLRRMGRKKAPHYRIVVAESSFPRDGRFVANVGHYNPRTEPMTLVVNRERALEWIAKGATPTDTVRSLFKRAGVYKPQPEALEVAADTVAGVASKAAGAVSRAAAKVKDAAEDALEAVADVAEDAVDAAKDAAETVVEAAKEVAEDVVERAKDVAEDVAERVAGEPDAAAGTEEAEPQPRA